MNELTHRVAVMDTTGTRLHFHRTRTEAQRLIDDGLAVRHDSKTLHLTEHPMRGGIGQSLPQYRDGVTMMHARYYAPTRSFLRW